MEMETRTDDVRKFIADGGTVCSFAPAAEAMKAIEYHEIPFEYGAQSKLVPIFRRFFSDAVRDPHSDAHVQACVLIDTAPYKDEVDQRRVNSIMRPTLLNTDKFWEIGPY